MHELSIAQSLIELAEDEVAAASMTGGTRTTDASPTLSVKRIGVRVGALSGVVPEALVSAYAVAIRRSALRGADLTIEACPAVIWCARCDAERPLPSPQSRRCPKCGELSADLRGGRELELAFIEFDDAEPPDAEPADDLIPDDRPPRPAAAHSPGADADPQEQ